MSSWKDNRNRWNNSSQLYLPCYKVNLDSYEVDIVNTNSPLQLELFQLHTNNYIEDEESSSTFDLETFCWITRNDVSLLKKDGIVIGMIALNYHMVSFNGDSIELVDLSLLCIAKEYRNKGLTTKFVNQTLNLLQSRGDYYHCAFTRRFDGGGRQPIMQSYSIDINALPNKKVYTTLLECSIDSNPECSIDSNPESADRRKRFNDFLDKYSIHQVLTKEDTMPWVFEHPTNKSLISIIPGHLKKGNMHYNIAVLRYYAPIDMSLRNLVEDLCHTLKGKYDYLLFWDNMLDNESLTNLPYARSTGNKIVWQVHVLQTHGAKTIGYSFV